MDPLALLCNLHADGPATLQRLRRAGCESLAALRRFDPASLAERLEWNERTAERFLREAALLGERVEHQEDATDELEAAEIDLEATLVTELDGETDEAESELAGDEEELEPDAQEDELEDLSVAESVAEVLGAWRELDVVTPPAEPAEFVIPRPEPAGDAPLSSVTLDGLSPGLLARLAELGIASVRGLAEASELELARAIPLGYTRVKHLRFQAARALERLATSTPAPAEGFEPFTPPPSEPFETAGPFA